MHGLGLVTYDLTCSGLNKASNDFEVFKYIVCDVKKKFDSDLKILSPIVEQNFCKIYLFY
jgi:hypothetical protein